MPVDLKRIASSVSLQEWYRKSLRLRSGENYQNNDITETVLPLEETFSMVLELFQREKNLWKERDRLLSEQRKNASDGSHREKIQAIEQEHEQLQNHLRNVWYKQLPNFVVSMCNDYESRGLHSLSSDPANQVLRETSEQSWRPCDFYQDENDCILFRIGGYEEIKSFRSVVIGAGQVATQSSVFLTDVGLDLAQRLEYSIQRYWYNNRIPVLCPKSNHSSREDRIRQWHLPANVPINSHILGAEVNNATAKWITGPDKKDTVSTMKMVETYIPSWLGLLQEQYGNRKLLDRDFPVFHWLTIADSDSTKRTNDGREEFRRQTMLPSKSSSKRPGWHQRCYYQKRYELLILTGPSWEVDIQPLQADVVRELLLMYQTWDCPVQARVTPTDQLQADEAGRIVIEGYYGKGAAICLAYVSNFLDYWCPTIRHATTKESLGVLHAVIANVPETLDWILQCTPQEPRSYPFRDYITLPHSLVINPAGCRNPDKVPITRRLATSKKGGKKTVIVERQLSKQTAIPLPLQPTMREIRLEEDSCPFFFLPFYSKSETSNPETRR